MLRSGKRAQAPAQVSSASAGRFTLISAIPPGPDAGSHERALMALRRAGARSCVAFSDVSLDQPLTRAAAAIGMGVRSVWRWQGYEKGAGEVHDLAGWREFSPVLHAAGEAGEPLGVIGSGPRDTALVSALLLADRGAPGRDCVAAAESEHRLTLTPDDALIIRQRAVPDDGLGRALFRSLLGGMIGDALDAEVEFLDAEAAASRFRAGFGLIPHQGILGAITDDSQMSLFVAEGLIEAGAGAPEDAVSGKVHEALLRWLDTQSGLPACGGRGLCLDERLRVRRAPGLTCLSGLSGSRAHDARAANDSKGNGTIMRVAPIALYGPADAVGSLAERLSYQTHGHPTAAVASGAWAVLIRALADGARIREAAEAGRAWAASRPGSAETLSAFGAAMTLAPRGPAEATAAFGNAGTAEVALAHALNACLRAEDARSAYEAAVVHGGDSDTVGSIAGNALGLMFPAEVSGGDWASRVQCVDLAARVARGWPRSA